MYIYIHTYIANPEEAWETADWLDCSAPPTAPHHICIYLYIYIYREREGER